MDGLGDQVRELWEVYERSGLDAFLERVPPDVEWKPLASRGKALVGRDALRTFLEQARENRTAVDATPLAFDEDGRCVMVRGSMRTPLPRGFSDSQPVWVYFFGRDGTLRRFEGFSIAADAAEAIAAWNDTEDGPAPGSH